MIKKGKEKTESKIAKMLARMIDKGAVTYKKLAMQLSKRSKPLEYKDIEYITRFNFFADDDEIRRVLNNFANAVKEYNK